jgi:hypothetical protein
VKCLLKMIEWGGEALFESRADWLGVEAVFCAEHFGFKVDSVIDLVRRIREVFR